MSWSFQKKEYPVARKEYPCDAYEWACSSPDDLTRDEIRIVGLSGGRIKKGEKYIKVTGKYEGDFVCFRANVALHDICVKYGLYPED
jgi:hypothetical protein